MGKECNQRAARLVFPNWIISTPCQRLTKVPYSLCFVKWIINPNVFLFFFHRLVALSPSFLFQIPKCSPFGPACPQTAAATAACARVMPSTCSKKSKPFKEIPFSLSLSFGAQRERRVIFCALPWRVSRTKSRQGDLIWILWRHPFYFFQDLVWSILLGLWHCAWMPTTNVNR